MTHPRKLVHTTRMPLRWGDMDAMGHVNNTVYFRYMEQTRIEWFYEFAKKIDTKPYAEQGPIIINASCTFLEPLVYPGDLEVRRGRGQDGLDRPPEREVDAAARAAARDARARMR